MMLIANDLKTDDIVYAHFTPFKETVKSSLKKGEQHGAEFKVIVYRPDWIRLRSTSGQYELVFTKELIENFNGFIKRR